MRRILKMAFALIGSLVLLLLIVAGLFIGFSPEFGGTSKGAQLEKIKASPNYEEGKFKNVQPTVVMKEMKWSSIGGYFSKGNTVPDWSLPVQRLKQDDLLKVEDSLIRLTWFGHSSLLLEVRDVKLFLDPMLGAVPAPHPWLGNKRFNDTLPMSIEQLPKLDAVLLSHDHYDHLDRNSILGLNEKVGHFYVPLGLGAHLMEWGVEEDRITEMDWWEEAEVAGIKLAAAPARHFSGRGLTDRYNTLWCSWVIQCPEGSIYFGGDSGYGAHFSEIGEKYGPFDFSMLECGQYNEQWPEIHMMPEETVQAAIDLNSKLMMPIHWGSFKLALHDWDDPVRRCLKTANAKGVNIATPKIGEPVVIGQAPPNSKWWEKPS